MNLNPCSPFSGKLLSECDACDNRATVHIWTLSRALDLCDECAAELQGKLEMRVANKLAGRE